MLLIRANTNVILMLGPFISDSDGKTPLTGLTIASTDVHIHQPGQTSNFLKYSGGGTHSSHGRYWFQFHEDDFVLPGAYTVFVQVTGALPVRCEVCALQEDAYDAMFHYTDGAIRSTVTDKTDFALSEDAIIDIEAVLANESIGEPLRQRIIDTLLTNLPDLDDLTLAAISNAVWTGASRTLTAVSDSSGTTTLLSRISSARAGYLDRLNVAGTLAHTGNASSFMADVSGLSTFDPSTDTVLVGDKTGFALSSTALADLEAALVDDAVGSDLRQKIADTIVANLPDGEDLTLSAIAEAVLTAIQGVLLDVNVMKVNGNNVSVAGVVDANIVSANGSALLPVGVINANIVLLDGNPFNLQTLVIPTTTEIATKVDETLTQSHGEGSWTGEEGGGSGTGARTVIIEVTDGTDPIQSATVRLSKGIESYFAVTNADGLAQFNVDDGEWRVSITRALYSFTGTTLTVSGDVEQTYEMDQAIITPSEPGRVTGYLTVYDHTGAEEPNAKIYITAREIPLSLSGVSLDMQEREVTAGANGLCSISNLFRGVVYSMRRGGSQKAKTVKIPTDAPDVFELPSFLGAD